MAFFIFKVKTDFNVLKFEIEKLILILLILDLINANFQVLLINCAILAPKCSRVPL